MKKNSEKKNIFLWGFELMIIPLLVGIGTFLANGYYDQKVEKQKKEDAYTSLKLGVSEKYMESKLGPAVYSIDEVACNYSKENIE